MLPAPVITIRRKKISPQPETPIQRFGRLRAECKNNGMRRVAEETGKTLNTHEDVMNFYRKNILKQIFKYENDYLNDKTIEDTVRDRYDTITKNDDTLICIMDIYESRIKELE